LAVRIPATNQTKVDGIGLFTGQVGYALNNVLLYVKGGAAVTDKQIFQLLHRNRYPVQSGQRRPLGWRRGNGN
jgi:hypothetical protein